MCTITIYGTEMFDEATLSFISNDDVTVDLEHSLASLSKWEQTVEKPFLSDEAQTLEEQQLYVKCMCLTPGVPEEVFSRLSHNNFVQINAYINAKMTATWFASSAGPSRSREIITAELIYYWMTAFSIPFECEHWHLTKLLTLIRVCNEKQSKPKKMSRSEIASRNRDLNARRKAELGTTG